MFGIPLILFYDPMKSTSLAIDVNFATSLFNQLITSSSLIVSIISSFLYFNLWINLKISSIIWLLIVICLSPLSSVTTYCWVYAVLWLVWINVVLQILYTVMIVTIVSFLRWIVMYSSHSNCAHFFFTILDNIGDLEMITTQPSVYSYFHDIDDITVVILLCGWILFIFVLNFFFTFWWISFAFVFTIPVNFLSRFLMTWHIVSYM